MITYECLKPLDDNDLRWTFDNWMGNTALLCDQIERRTCSWYDEPFLPFHDNENSGVGVLLAGAAKAGFLPFSEYAIEKQKGTEKKNGRADLWFIAGEKAHSFEFKRSWNKATPLKLADMMRKADQDIKQIPLSEYDFAFSGMIAPLFPEWTKEESLRSFVGKVDCCYLIGDQRNYLAYLYFNRKV